MKLTFSKKLHMNRTIRYIDIITDETIDNNYNATLVYIPTMREYVTVDYERGINTDIIVGIRYVANSYIRIASTITLDFSNEFCNEYYHFTDCSGCIYNSLHVPTEYLQFVNKLTNIMDIYS